MKKYIVSLVAIILSFVVVSLSSRVKYSYVGLQKCINCHGSDSVGNQYKIWKSSPHANAARRLQTKQAKKIAALYNISSPATSRKCLKCHTTGRGKVAALNTEGVGCEACHGPGERYHGAGVHVNYIDRKQGYKKAIKYGMYPILYDHLKNREKLCLHCHSFKRPCFTGEGNKRIEQKLTIQVIDKLQKNNKSFRHPIRK